MSQAETATPLRRRTGTAENTWARVGKISSRITLYVLMVAVVFLAAFPFFWMISTSFKAKTEMFVVPPTLLPTHWTLQGYFDLFQTTAFGYYYRNSAIIAIATTVLSVGVGSFAAYALSRFRFWGFRAYLRLILFTYMMPSTLLVIPLYVLATKVHLQDTLIVLIITDSTAALPFTVWLLRSYFASISVDIEEAALMDGCGRLGSLFRVVLPIAIPGIVSTSIFAFTAAWNEFLYALVFITTDTLRTLPVGMNSWVGGGDSQMSLWSMVLAGAVLMTAPVLIFYGLVQRNLVVDLSAGGAKG